MNNKLLLGFWRMMIPIPERVWQREASGDAKQTVARLGFMSEEHHLIRDFVVRELPIVGEPLAPEVIAQEVGLRRERVVALLDELERKMTFLFRNEEGASCLPRQG